MTLSDISQGSNLILWITFALFAIISMVLLSGHGNAVWLIDYWCNKDVRGLIQMPFSRHWIMHTEACLRIKNKIHP